MRSSSSTSALTAGAPGQDIAGVVLRAAAEGTGPPAGPPAGTPVVAYPEWHGWAERITAPDLLRILADDLKVHCWLRHGAPSSPGRPAPAGAGPW